MTDYLISYYKSSYDDFADKAHEVVSGDNLRSTLERIASEDRFNSFDAVYKLVQVSQEVELEAITRRAKAQKRERAYDDLFRQFIQFKTEHMTLSEAEYLNEKYTHTFSVGEQARYLNNIVTIQQIRKTPIGECYQIECEHFVHFAFKWELKPLK